MLILYRTSWFLIKSFHIETVFRTVAPLNVSFFEVLTTLKKYHVISCELNVDSVNRNLAGIHDTNQILFI